MGATGNCRNRTVHAVKMFVAAAASIANIIFSGVLAFLLGMRFASLFSFGPGDVFAFPKVALLLCVTLTIQYFIFKAFFHLRGKDTLPFFYLILSFAFMPLIPTRSMGFFSFVVYLLLYFGLFIGCAWRLSNNAQRNRERSGNRSFAPCGTPSTTPPAGIGENEIAHAMKMVPAAVGSVVNTIFSGALAFRFGTFFFDPSSFFRPDIFDLLIMALSLTASLTVQYFIFRAFFHLRGKDTLPFFCIILSVVFMPLVGAHPSFIPDVIPYFVVYLMYFILFIGCAWRLSNNAKRNREQSGIRPESDV